MIPARFLLLLPSCLASASCSVAVYSGGRDPADLVGRSRAEITSEFGPPVRSGTWRRRQLPLTYPPEFEEMPVEIVRVKGSWRHEFFESEAFDTAFMTLCIGEPILFPYSIAHKTVLNGREQDLEIAYENGIVEDARMAYIGAQKLPGPNP